MFREFTSRLTESDYGKEWKDRRVSAVFLMKSRGKLHDIMR
jgi:hypothetical protein